MSTEHETINGERTLEECQGTLHPKAIEGLRLFNDGEYFEAHEELETAWRDETKSHP